MRFDGVWCGAGLGGVVCTCAARYCLVLCVVCGTVLWLRCGVGDGVSVRGVRACVVCGGVFLCGVCACVRLVFFRTTCTNFCVRTQLVTEETLHVAR